MLQERPIFSFKAEWYFGDLAPFDVDESSKTHGSCTAGRTVGPTTLLSRGVHKEQDVADLRLGLGLQI